MHRVSACRAGICRTLHRSCASADQAWRRRVVALRRSRALAADSRAAAQVPLVENSKAYVVDILVGVTIKRTLADKLGHHGPHHYAGYFCTESGTESVIYMTFHDAINDEARELLDIFSRNMAMAYECMLLRESTKNVPHSAIQSWTEPVGGAL